MPYNKAQSVGIYATVIVSQFTVHSSMKCKCVVGSDRLIDSSKLVDRVGLGLHVLVFMKTPCTVKSGVINNAHNDRQWS